MTKGTKLFLIIGLIAVFVAVFIRFAPDYLSIMKPAPPGIHGNYSLAEYDLTYKTEYDKDSLLHNLEKDGLDIRSGRLHDYDPPWDSLRYLVGNIRCDTQQIESYIEFRKEKQDGFTTFRILGMSATPNESYDTMLYRNLTKKYYDCFETILSRHGVKYK